VITIIFPDFPVRRRQRWHERRSRPDAPAFDARPFSSTSQGWHPRSRGRIPAGIFCRSISPPRKWSPRALPPRGSPASTALFRNLVTYRHRRLATWREYADTAFRLRSSVSEACRGLHRGWGQMLGPNHHSVAHDRQPARRDARPDPKAGRTPDAAADGRRRVGVFFRGPTRRNRPARRTGVAGCNDSRRGGNHSATTPPPSMR